MEKKQYSTSQLTDVLKSVGVQEISQYEREYLLKETPSFVTYMDELISARGLKRQDVFQRADIPQKYGYKLLTGESHTRDRDKLIRIFLAMNLSLKEVKRGLELYGMPLLYPRIKRDAILMIAFNRGCSSVDEVNRLLTENGEAELSRSRD